MFLDEKLIKNMRQLMKKKCPRKMMDVLPYFINNSSAEVL